MLIHRVARTGTVALLSVAALAGCRSAPDVAAYVGDERITVAELEAAVRERLADEDVAAWAEGREDELTRRVLTGLVEQEVHAAAAERADLRVTDDEVSRRIDQLLVRDDPDAVYQQLAQQGIARADVRETIRQQLLRRELAGREGEAGALEESALRARYDEVRPGLAQVEFGYATVPDQAGADALLAAITADPGRYAELVAPFQGAYTLPELEARPAEDVPPSLAEQLQAAAPGTGFTVAVEETGGVVVAFLAGTVYPTFEEVRPRLEEEAGGQVDAAGAELVDEVRADLDVTVNPRYGVLEENRVEPGEGGVVDLLEEAGASADE
ncbi:SurA N-terminal domain-containing protein [Blastococcus sp. TF02A_35]|uniref:SurA N-terminal domain-containing protein n=1 Tax=Blastococcus sp. TF02A-35 TaxID=2559612 RepID=UPI0010730C9F|nr:SurA N-terminal domain-containing protein [Blastococcus sp. TF02A_35]TFV52988.1 hypothetical protein E4P43_03600 [Blastococcus sp. TF02A_35]